MINYIHYLTHRPEMGWDPIPEAHVQRYGEAERVFVKERTALVSELCARLGGLSGKTVLDLGGGPGHYTAEFAGRGARVTWLDVSALYAAMAEANCVERGVQAEFRISYIDDVARLGRTFDLVFSRLCWNYALAEPPLARAIIDVLGPGGAAYIETANCTWKPGTSLWARVRAVLNGRLGIKIGHPFPPAGRTAALFRRDPRVRVEELPGDSTLDRLLVWKLT